MKLLFLSYFFALSVSTNAAQNGHSAVELLITPQTHPALQDILYVCEYAGTERIIELNYDVKPPLPCEVVYHREQEGIAADVLWQAKFDIGFCEDKTQQLISQLQQQGWLCEKS